MEVRRNIIWYSESTQNLACTFLVLKLANMNFEQMYSEYFVEVTFEIDLKLIWVNCNCECFNKIQ